MNMVEPLNFKLGPYTIRHRQEPGQQCPLYCVFLDCVLIGKCISVPDLDACKWLERQQREQTFYAYSTTSLCNRWEQRNAIRRQNTGGAHAMARNRKKGAPRKPETLRDIKKALAGG